MSKASLTIMRLAASIRTGYKQLRSGVLTDAEYDVVEAQVKKAQANLLKLFRRQATAKLRRARGD
jgi:hypothetical protein